MTYRNLQNKTICEMAKNSLNANKTRNIFVILTIILSVSLLTVIFLFGTGTKEESRRKMEGAPHAVFGNLTQDTAAKLKTDSRISDMVEAKQGIPTEMDGYNVVPRYIEKLTDEINIGKLEEGRLPEKIYEAAVQPEYLEKIGKEPKVGETFEVTFYDGVTETFRVTGLVSGSKGTKNYTLMVSRLYAEMSKQMADIPFEIYAKIKDGKSLTKTECKDVIYQVGLDAGVEYKNCMPNNSFLDTLSVDWQQMQIAVIVAGVILLACILVIYGVFYISVVGRIHQFGQMRTIGMTRKQIKRFVKKEGRALFVRAFPAGLAIGGAAGYFIKPQGFEWKNTLIVFAAVTVITYLVTMLSVIKPAKIAADISPMEALRYTPQDGIKKNAASKECRILTDFGLGIMNYTKNRKKEVITMLSLALGGILFMVASTYMTSFDQDLYSRQGAFEQGEFDIKISAAAVELDEHGLSGIQNANPLDNDFEQKIRDIDGVKEIYKKLELGAMFDAAAYGEYGDDTGITFMQEKEIDAFKELLIDEELNTEKLLSGDYVLVQGGDVMEEIYGWRLKKGDQVTFHYFDGSGMAERTLEVLAVSDELLDTMQEGWFYVPETAVGGWTTFESFDKEWIVSTEADKEAKVGEKLKELLADQPLLTMETLQDRKEVDEVNCSRLFAAIAGISIFVIMFSILSMMNTLITNIITRKQELAMLESIGMQQRQILKMLLSESMIIAGINVIITLTAGTAAGWGLCRLLNTAGLGYMIFTFPAVLFAVYTVVLFAVPIVITVVTLMNFSKEPLVERIRGQEC